MKGFVLVLFSCSFGNNVSNSSYSTPNVRLNLSLDSTIFVPLLLKENFTKGLDLSAENTGTFSGLLSIDLVNPALNELPATRPIRKACLEGENQCEVDHVCKPAVYP